jgi:hypothetical protein
MVSSFCFSDRDDWDFSSFVARTGSSSKFAKPKLDSRFFGTSRGTEPSPLPGPRSEAFEGDDPKPISDVMTQIWFTPPDIKTFKITDAQGSPRGQKIVSAILDQEIVSAKEGHRGDISRSNYDFVILREQDFGVVPEYVLRIIPKRKEKGLLLGDIWVC